MQSAILATAPCFWPCHYDYIFRQETSSASVLYIDRKLQSVGHPKLRLGVFCPYLLQNWIDLRQTKTKMVSAHSTHLVKYISSAKIHHFLDNLNL